jgi:hypothetical protein
VVFYRGDEVLGGGRIAGSRVPESYARSLEKEVPVR